MKNIWKFIISVAIPLMVSVLGGLITSSSVNSWYTTLEKPFFNPPSWIFGPVWTILYILMGVALYLVWKERSDITAFLIFGIQLILNFLWSTIFFGLQSPLFAFIEIILLWIAIVTTMVYFYKIRKVATYVLIPYILWVSFAAILNLSIVLLN